MKPCIELRICKYRFAAQKNTTPAAKTFAAMVKIPS